MVSWYKSVKARKNHMCIICRKIIKSGTTYIMHTEQYGDGFSSRRMHRECDSRFDDYLEELSIKVEEAEKESLVEPLEYADPDDFYLDDSGNAQWGVSEGIFRE